GLYGFLQDHLGCGFFTPGVTHVPRRPTLRLGDIDDRQSPAFRWRSTNPPLHWDAAWTVRNRLNEAKTYGGTMSLQALMDDPRARTLGNYYAAHAFSYIPDDLFDEHPEFYMEQDGRRTRHENPNDRAYCVSNRDFARYMADRITRGIRPDGDPVRVGLGHADNGNFCRCAECSAQYEKLGIAGVYLQFNNLVAREAGRRLPHVTVGTLAYGLTFKPPPFPMEPNLYPTWCPISACYVHGFDECNPNRDRDFVGQLRQWLDRTEQLGIWYYHHQSDALMPHPHVFATQKNLRIFRAMGVDGVFIEDTVGHTVRRHDEPDGDKTLPAYGNAERNGYFTVTWGSVHLQNYIGARLLWNPDADVKTMIREFCTTYYGPAADALTDWFTTTQSIDAYERTLGTTFSSYPGVHLSGSRAPLMRWNEIVRLDQRFDEAEAAVADDPTRLRRVRMARLSLQLAILCFAPPEDPRRDRAYKSFFDLMERLGFKSIARTAVSPERRTLYQLKALFANPGDLPIPGRENLGDNLLDNPGMEIEIDGDGIPDGWSASGRYQPEGYILDPAGIRLDDAHAHGGKRSLRLSKSRRIGHTVALRQRFNATPGRTYRMSVRYRARVERGGLHIIFTRFAEDGRELGHSSGARGANDTGGAWFELQAETTADDDVAQLMAEVLFYDDKAEGVAWVDDFTCREVTR
ncbi:MAG: hypothetical protein CMJ18_07300, partial [Phycisphaeraceae bacterium]|nr:hypothetical protein [Phycisphaeraceae bacterium]